MFEVLISFLLSFRVYFRTRSDNQLEILALRHQISYCNERLPNRKLKPTDRRLWVWLSQCWPRWRSALLIVKPTTVVDWHRRGFVGTGLGKSDTDMSEGQALRKKHAN